VKITRLLHVSVNVEGELDASRTFYEQLLGLGPIPRPDIPGVDGSWLGLPGGEQLHLVDAPTGPAGIQPTGHHFCVAVDDLDGAIAELEAREIAYKRGAQGDVVQIWIVDPAGNTIEFQQETNR
jgi:catechol 2,3-dioxygenase-like lactoylglutathione lyase family enzyme